MERRVLKSLIVICIGVAALLFYAVVFKPRVCEVSMHLEGKTPDYFRCLMKM